MVLNIAIWTDPGLFGVYGNDLRNTWSNPFINTFVKIGGTVQAGLPAWPVFETVVGIVLAVGALYYVVAQRGKARRLAGRGGRRDRRGRDRLTEPPNRTSVRAGRRASVAPPARDRGWRCDDEATEALHGELRDELVHAMQRVPELAGRDLTLVPLSGGITNRNFRVDVGDPANPTERFVIRLGGNDTHLLGISREVEHAATVAAAGVGVGAEVLAFLRPEGYLVTRFIEGTPMADLDVHRPDVIARVADSVRRFHEGPAIPGLFIPLRVCEAYRALAEARGVPVPPEYGLAQAIGRRIELALIMNPLELRPCHNDFLPGNLIDDGARMRIVDWEYAGMGDPFFDLGNFSINNDLTPDEDEAFLAAYDGNATPRADRLARLTLFRVVSDFREAMWGVLQQGISTLDFDFRGYADEHFERLLANAATPRFEHALGEVGDA